VSFARNALFPAKQHSHTVDVQQIALKQVGIGPFRNHRE